MTARLRRHWLALALLLAATWLVRTRLGAAPPVPPRQALASFPDQVGVWKLTGQPALSTDVVGVLKADDYMVRDYAGGPGGAAQLFVAYYRTQHAGESMHSPKNCLPGAGWFPLLSDTIPLPAAGGAAVNRYVVGRDGDRDLMLYWYEAQGRIIASEYSGKVYLLWDAMRTGRRDGAIVRVLVPMTPGESVSTATAAALTLANPALPLLQTFLPAAGGPVAR